MNNSDIDLEGIVADTSQYPIGSAARAKALLLCERAQSRGKTIQHRFDDGEWRGFRCIFDCDGTGGGAYRVKPEPEVTTRIEWDLYVPKVTGETKFGLQKVDTYASREGALATAGGLRGSVFVDQMYVTLHDGEVVSRKSVYS